MQIKDVFFLGAVRFGERDICKKQLEFCNAMNCLFQQANANEESKFYHHCGECFELESWVHFGYDNIYQLHYESSKKILVKTATHQKQIFSNQ
jgi:hypothetical protein